MVFRPLELLKKYELKVQVAGWGREEGKELSFLGISVGVLLDRYQVSAFRRVLLMNEPARLLSLL